MAKNKHSMNTVYIGYDPKEDTAYEVLKFSIERIATKPVRVVPIKRNIVERMGLYTRKHNTISGQPYDEIDGKAFSTEFSFTRFLVPALNMYEGMALFMDSDMYMRTDVTELFEECSDGDINNDNVVNVLDVVGIVSYVLGNQSLTQSQIDLSDLNGDGVVNILDVGGVVNIILESE